MKQSDVKTRRVMDFDTFKGAYDRALHPVSRDPDAPLQDGSRKMTAFPAHVRNDSNPYRAFEIPYDKEEADSNMRIMAHPPVFATGGANATGELGESVKYKGQLVRLGDNHGDLSGYAPLDNVEIVIDGEPVLVKFKDLEIVDESARTEGQRAWRIPDDKRDEYFEIQDKMENAVGFRDSGYDAYSDPIVKFEDFTSLSQRNQEFWIAQMKRIGAVEVTDAVFEGLFVWAGFKIAELLSPIADAIQNASNKKELKGILSKVSTDKNVAIKRVAGVNLSDRADTDMTVHGDKKFLFLDSNGVSVWLPEDGTGAIYARSGKDVKSYRVKGLDGVVRELLSKGEVSEAMAQDPGDNSHKLNLKVGDKVWTVMGPCAGKDYFGVVESDVRKKGMDYVVDVTFYRGDTGKICAGKDEYEVDYLHRLDGKKIY